MTSKNLISKQGGYSFGIFSQKKLYLTLWQRSTFIFIFNSFVVFSLPAVVQFSGTGCGKDHLCYKKIL